MDSATRVYERVQRQTQRPQVRPTYTISMSVRVQWGTRIIGPSSRHWIGKRTDTNAEAQQPQGVSSVR